MIPTSVPDLVIFAINSTLNLGSQIRSSIIDNIKSKELILPIPDFNPNIDWKSASRWFRLGDGQAYANEDTEIKRLLELGEKLDLPDHEADRKQFVSIYNEFWAINQAKNGKPTGDFGLDSLTLITRVRQWERGSNPNPKPIQRIAGTLIDIGVDYFQQFPEAINENSKHAKVIREFVSTLDDKQFAEKPLKVIAGDLLLATLDTVSENPNLFTTDETSSELIHNISKGLFLDLTTRIENAGEEGDQVKVKQWGQLVFRSVLKSTGETVLADPNKFLGIKEEAPANIVRDVGKNVLSILLDPVEIAGGSTTDKIALSKLFSKASVDQLVKTSFEAIANNPQIIGFENKGIQNIVVGLARDLAQKEGGVFVDIVPEASRIIIEKSAENLGLLWPKASESNDPATNLLFKTVQQTLAGISQTTDGAWKPSFNKEQLSNLLNTVTDEVIQNPDWLLKGISGNNTVLFEALQAAVKSWGKVGDRFSPKAGLSILEAILKHVTLRQEFLDKIDFGNNAQKEFVISIAIDIVLDTIVGDTANAKVTWALAKENVMKMLIEAVLDKLSQVGPSSENIQAVEKIISDHIKELMESGPFSLEGLLHKIATTEIQ